MSVGSFTLTTMRKLRKRRMKIKATQEELATRAGVTRPYLVKLEGGNHTPSAETLFRIERALKALEKKVAKRSRGVQTTRRRKSTGKGGRR